MPFEQAAFTGKELFEELEAGALDVLELTLSALETAEDEPFESLEEPRLGLLELKLLDLDDGSLERLD